MSFAAIGKARSAKAGGGMTEQQKSNWLQEMALSFEVRDPRAMTIRFGNGASGSKWKSQLALGPTWHRIPRPTSGPMSKAACARGGRAGGVYNPGDFPLERQTTQLQGCAHGPAQHDQRLEDITPAPATRAGRLSRAEQGMNMAQSEYEELARHALKAAAAPQRERAANRRMRERATKARAMTDDQAAAAVARARQRADLCTLLRLMHRFVHAERVQRAGCAAMLALAREEQMGRRPALMAEVEQRALACTHAMLRAIWSHPAAPRVAELACAALMELVPCHAAAAEAVAEVADVTQRDLLGDGASLGSLRMALRGSRARGGSQTFAMRRPDSAGGGGGGGGGGDGSGRPATAPYVFVKRNGCCCDAICAAMEAHPHHPGLQRRAAAALAVIAQASARAAQYLRDTAAHELLRHALATFPIDAAVCANARRALKLLGVPVVQDLAEDELHVDDDLTLFETLASGGFPDTQQSVLHSPSLDATRREQEQEAPRRKRSLFEVALQ
jgi:hypothetical protein